MTGRLKNAPGHSLLNQFKTDRFKRFGKEFTWIVLGQAATMLGALVGVRILTGLLAPAEYGQLALGMTAATLIQSVVLGPLGKPSTSFLKKCSVEGFGSRGIRRLFRLRTLSAIARKTVLIRLDGQTHRMRHYRWKN